MRHSYRIALSCRFCHAFTFFEPIVMFSFFRHVFCLSPVVDRFMLPLLLLVTRYRVCHPSPLPSPSLFTTTVCLFLRSSLRKHTRLETHSRYFPAPLGARACPPSVTTSVTLSVTPSVTPSVTSSWVPSLSRSLLRLHSFRDCQTSEVRLPTI